jgi:uncharacterized damage-inducible protein DinB
MAAMNTLIEAYVEGARQLRQAVAGLTREQIVARPIAGKWSILEVIAHLADFEPVYVDRMKRVIAEDNPTLLGADQDKFAKALGYQDRDLQEDLTIIEVTRSQMARILRKLPDAALQRTGVHNERGPMTLEKLLTTITGHIPHHLKFIVEKRQALGAK